MVAAVRDPMMNSCAQVLRKALQDLSWSADGKVCVPTGFGFRSSGLGFRASGLGFCQVLGLGFIFVRLFCLHKLVAVQLLFLAY